MRALCRHFALPLALAAGTALWGQDLSTLEKKVTEFTLANGAHFIVVERHQAPVVSFSTWVDAGAAEDPAGATGLAHMFEHLAFKGTATIGTSNWPSEKQALDEADELADRVEAERNKGPRADEARLDVLEMQVNTAQSRAASFVEPGGFAAALEARGAIGLTARSFYDHTEYHCSLPSNRLELWFFMESQRLLAPVFRDFYSERAAMLEEQRLQVEASPKGTLEQEFLAAAFEANPYHRPEIGWPGDIASLRRADARAFFDKYFTAANITFAIVGDVAPDEVRRFAERYFGPLPARPAPPPPHTAEAPQRGLRGVHVESQTQSILAIGFKRPSQRDPDDPALRLLGLILSGGRTGMLHQDLVQGQRIAIQAQAVAAFPSGRYPCLFAFMLAPSIEHTVQEVEKAVDALVARLQSQKVDDDILSRARSAARARLISQLEGNQGLAELLPGYYAAFGDWRELFHSLAALDKVTADDIQRVARKYLIQSQRTVAYSSPPAPPPARPAQPSGGRP